MSFGLYRGNDEFYCNGVVWGYLLRLAHQYGWEPQGTEGPDWGDEWAPFGDWDGGYVTNDHQIVKAEDAQNMAAALKKALAAGQESLDNVVVDGEPHTRDCALILFSESQASLKRFIKLCEGGYFVIS